MAIKIILLHGFCQDKTAWTSMIEHSRFREHIAALDLPGFGDEPALSGTTVDSMARSINERTAGQDKFILLGHSMGGYVTLAFADLFKERLAGFGLIHSTTIADTDEKKANREKAIAFIEKHGAKKFTEETVPKWFAPGADQEKINKALQIAASSSNEGLIEATRAMMMRPDRGHVLTGSATSVLFIAGKSDPLIPLNDMISQASTCDHSMFELLEHSGHMGFLEEPAQMAKAIDLYYSEITGS